MTGLNYKLMPNLEGHQVQQVPLVQIMTLLQMIDSHKITSQFSKCQQLRRRLMLKMQKKLSLNKKTPMKLKKNKKLQLHQKEHHLFWNIDQRKKNLLQRKVPLFYLIQ
jgi:hypothetical protein